MKDIFNVVIFLFILSCSPSKEKVLGYAKAQKIITTDEGALSVGILIPDRGMADPHVWIENDRLYVMCGHDQSWEDKNIWLIDRWELWSSDNLIDWSHHINIYPTETYIGDKANCWAGDICERDGKYYWFFSNKNIDTGVMVADKITGPYQDLLGRPILHQGLVEKPSYDPEIYIENGIYSICFGVERYYMATLSKDMRSLITEPRPIYVMDDGVEVGTDDKPTLFKRGNWYYLAFGNQYAMSKDLYGDYEYQGEFVQGGHNSVFEWQGQWYVIMENNDTNIFFRGISLQPIYFNDDGTIRLASKMSIHPGKGRVYSFTASSMGWHPENNKTTLTWNENGRICGEIKGDSAAIGSAIFLMNNLDSCSYISFNLINNTSSKRARVSIASHTPEPLYWERYPIVVDWSKHHSVEVDIQNNRDSMQYIEIPLLSFGEVRRDLMKIKIEPALGAVSGSWSIDNIVLD